MIGGLGVSVFRFRFGSRIWSDYSEHCWFCPAGSEGFVATQV